MLREKQTKITIFLCKLVRNFGTYWGGYIDCLGTFKEIKANLEKRLAS